MIEQYNNGALRSKKLPHYRDISLSFLNRLGEAFSEGHVKYEQNLPPQEKNYMRGDLDFACDVLDHAIEHLYSYKEYLMARLSGDVIREKLWGEEDHLGHLAANLVMLDYFEKVGIFSKSKNEEIDGITDVTQEIISPKPNDIFEETLGKKILKGLGIT